MFNQFPRRRFALASVLLLGLAGCGESQNNSEPNADVVTPTAEPLSLWPSVQSEVARSPEIEQKIDDLIARMTLEEKVGQILQGEIQTIQPGDIRQYHLGSVLNGGGSVPYRKENPTTEDWVTLADSFYDESMDTSDGGVAIPVIWGTDAVHGHNNARGATIFPHNIGLGATRNPQLIREIGEATAEEVRATGIDWIFAPTLAVAQNDRWGRTYESYSEAPALVAEYALAMVYGLQGKPGSNFLAPDRAVATAKHFLGDGGTDGGDDQGNAKISEAELVSIHNAGYPPAIAAGVQTVMASFNSWNGEKMHGNPMLLTGALKEKMQFDGLVVGDWNGHGQLPGCTNDSCAKAINAGIDLVMVPYDWKAMHANTLAQVKSGEISMARLDDAVRRILRVKLRAGLFDAKPSERAGAGDPSVVGSAAHRAIGRQAVRESLVLLTNHGKILPLNPAQTVLVAGDGANNIGKQSGGWSVTWQGTGNSNDKFPGATSIYQGIRAAVEAAGGTAVLSESGDYQQKPDVAIVVFGEDPYAEGQGDTDTVEFQPGNKRALALLERLREQQIPVVSVFISGRPLWVNPEINASNAFVAAWLPGTEGGGVADVLFSKADGSVNYNFTGKLSFSWPNSPLDARLNPQDEPYRPLFAYGYGLDYDAELQGPLGLPEKVAGVAKAGAADVDFYMGRPIQPWNVFIRNPNRHQILSGAFAEMPEGDVRLQTTDKDVQEDALQLTWKDTWRAQLTIERGRPLDLREHLKKGVLSFDLKVVDIAKGGFDILLNCGEGCERKVPFTDQARQLAGQGWQNVRLSMTCFYQDGDDFSAVPVPFTIDAGGAGQIEVANVRFLLEGEANADCPDYKTVAITPAMLSTYWAIEWWEPRHLEKLAQVQRGDVDLLMIGDSITHGWENEGASVWQQYYARRKAVNLGFSGDRTENVLWRFAHGEIDGISPKVAVLMIGTNNTGHRLENPDYTFSGIRTIVETLRKKMPETKILTLAIFPRDAEPGTPMRTINSAVNEKIKTLADNQHVFYLDINQTFLDSEGRLSTDIMPDLLHPNEHGYQLWAKAMEPTLAKLLNE